MTGAITIRAILPITSQRTKYQGRADFLERLIPYAEPIHDARPELLNHNIIPLFGHQFLDDGGCAGTLQVQAQAAFRTVEKRMLGGNRAGKRRKLPGKLRPVGRFDAYDVGA